MITLGTPFFITMRFLIGMCKMISIYLSIFSKKFAEKCFYFQFLE
eukprot:UN12152